MRALISGEDGKEALLALMAVLQRAGVTAGMLTALTASRAAGVLPTEGGAVEPPAIAAACEDARVVPGRACCHSNMQRGGAA